jgi:hypothetical protein
LQLLPACRIALAAALFFAPASTPGQTVQLNAARFPLVPKAAVLAPKLPRQSSVVVRAPARLSQTAYVDTGQASVAVYAAAGGDSGWDISPTAEVPVQNGKIYWTKEVTSTTARELGIVIKAPGTSPFNLFSCDFVRVR